MLSRFSRLEMLIGSKNLHDLSQKSVLVLGCGGVGGYCIEALARSNIGKLILVDYDTVDISNINRQIIATDETLTKRKVDVFKERIKVINPSCEVKIISKFISKDNFEEIFTEKIDFVVDACDTVTTKKELIKRCLINGTPFLTCLGTGNRFDPAKLEITTLDKTSYDPIARILRKFVKDENIDKKITVLASREAPLKINSQTPGSTAFVPASAGLLIASYVVSYLLNLK